MSGDLVSKALLAEFLSLDPLEQAQGLKEYAKQLDIGVGDLRKIVSELSQPELSENDDVVENLEPVDYEVSGVELAAHIRDQLAKYVHLQPLDYVPIVLWAFGSYTISSFRIFPRLHIHSPEKRCGKSTLLECLEAYCCRSCMTSNISAAALFRMIDAAAPTLIIDEVDSFLTGNEEMRGVINSGHTRRTAFVIRTQGDDHTPTKFSTWTPMILSGIGAVPETIADRSVSISMQRAVGKEKPEKMPMAHFESEVKCRRQLLRWALDNEVSASNPPEIENSRAMDNWSVLFAIADAIGGEWPELCQSAYIRKNKVTEADDDSITTLLLTDIKAIFAEGGDRLFSSELAQALGEQGDRPWSEWSHGKSITQNGLAKLLKPFGIKPVQVRIGETKKRGYMEKQFLDCFARYIQTGTTVQPSNDAASSDFQTGTPEVAVTLQKALQPSEYVGCTTVPVQSTVIMEEI